MNTSDFKIIYDTTIKESDLNDGRISFITWHNNELISALKMMFHIRPNEEIQGITINSDGIKARIKLH